MELENARTLLNAGKPINSLSEFYTLMLATREIRLNIVSNYLASGAADSSDIDFLQKAVAALNAIEETMDGRLLLIDEKRTIAIDLTYEENELQKDIIFLAEGEKALYDHFQTIHPTFTGQTDQYLPHLQANSFKNLITDRDGTVNNYCGRYLSSIQSVYNSVFLTRFAWECVENALLLTSAPLENGGMVDICTMPAGSFILAGSKGREYRDKENIRGTYAINPDQQKQINALTEQIAELIQKPEFEKFSYIGSGFQRKFGQITIARQDISNSIPVQESNEFLQLITLLVSDLDREKEIFRIEDTGLDIEIILTVNDPSNKEEAKDFDKGDGIDFLDDKLQMNLHEGPNLICGDTGSDIAMLKTSLKKTSETVGIFVTSDGAMQEKVQKVQPETVFLDEPDTLVVLLNELAKGAIKK